MDLFFNAVGFVVYVYDAGIKCQVTAPTVCRSEL